MGRLGTLAVALLLLGACARSSPRPAVTGSPGPASPSPAASPAAEPPPASPSPSPSPAPAASPSPRPAASPAAGPGPTTAAAGLRHAAPGRYSYDDSGYRRLRGCLVRDDPAPSPTSLVVEPAQGNRQTATRDQRAPDGTGSVTVTTLELTADGASLAYLRQTQTTLLGTNDVEFEPSPPVPAIPASPAPGSAWTYSLTSKDGKVTVAGEASVEAVGEEMALADGTRAPTVRVRTAAHVTGMSAQGTLDVRETHVAWVWPERGLVVRQVDDSKGRAGLCELEWHTESVLRSAAPG